MPNRNNSQEDDGASFLLTDNLNGSSAKIKAFNGGSLFIGENDS